MPMPQAKWALGSEPAVMLSHSDSNEPLVPAILQVRQPRAVGARTQRLCSPPVARITGSSWLPIGSDPLNDLPTQATSAGTRGGFFF